jgi:hypothetical protein
MLSHKIPDDPSEQMMFTALRRKNSIAAAERYSAILICNITKPRTRLEQRYMELSVFLDGLNDGMKFEECARPELRALGSRVVELVFYLSYALFAYVVVRRYQ